MKSLISLVLGMFLVVGVAACSESSSNDGDSHSADSGSHAHDGITHDDHGAEEGSEDPAHDETSLGTVSIDGMDVELAQGHGAVAPGKEGHLIVKLPYSDSGDSVVRAWIGTSDRTLSLVGKGEYALLDGVYNIHAMAPSPLPTDTMWWIEVEKSDGTKVLGSAKPIVD